MAMSSTSRLPAEAPTTRHDNDDFERRFGRALPLGLPIVFGGSAIAVGFIYDLGTALLVLGGGTLLATIALLWASLRTLAGDAPISLDEAVALGTTTANDEHKRTILQALKDLDYEFSVGKIGEEDYRELRSRYRAEAKKLLRSLDRDLEPSRARAEAYVAGRLSGKPDSVLTSQANAEGSRACDACGVGNDEDARFCKGCGAGLGGVLAKEEARDAAL